MELFIKNRQWIDLHVSCSLVEAAKWLAIVMHGFTGFKDQPQIQAMAQALFDNNFNVIIFDTTNSLWKSGGDMMYATLDQYYQDLQDVISWAKAQDFYNHKLVLAGHSLGAYCSMRYAIDYPQDIIWVVSVSAFVSGKDYYTKQGFDLIKKCEQDWFISYESNSKPGTIKIIPWKFIKSILPYNIIPDLPKIKVSTLFVIWAQDRLFDERTNEAYPSLWWPKHLHIIKDAGHNFRQSKQYNELEQVVNDRIKKTF